DEEMALQQPCDLVADPASAVARVDDEASRLGDPVPLVRAVKAGAPGTLAVQLDDEPAVLERLALRALDLGQHVLERLAGAPPEEGPGLLVRDQLEQETGIVGSRAAELDAHSGNTRVRRDRRTPEPRATPPRINASPPKAAAPKRSSRKIAP